MQSARTVMRVAFLYFCVKTIAETGYIHGRMCVFVCLRARVCIFLYARATCSDMMFLSCCS